jgi:hypothetical protein
VDSFRFGLALPCCPAHTHPTHLHLADLTSALPCPVLTLSCPILSSPVLTLCRRPLATSQYIIPHGTSAPTDADADAPPAPAASSSSSSSSCQHYFLDPLSWMRPELELGKLEGRLECPTPKCRSNVGKYAWQGMQCSCGEWIVPGISLAKGRIDEARRGPVQGIRRPPGAVGGQNL